MVLTVHSDGNRVPRYYVTDEAQDILFESASGSEALQWAINFEDVIEFDGTIDVDGPIRGKGRDKTKLITEEG